MFFTNCPEKEILDCYHYIRLNFKAKKRLIQVFLYEREAGSKSCNLGINNSTDSMQFQSRDCS